MADDEDEEDEDTGVNCPKCNCTADGPLQVEKTGLLYRCRDCKHEFVPGDDEEEDDLFKIDPLSDVVEDRHVPDVDSEGGEHD